MFSLRFKLRFHSVEKDKTWQNKYNKYKTSILVNRQVWVRSHRNNSITKTRRYSPCWALLPSPPRFPRFAFSSLSQKHTFPWRDHQAYYKEKINTFRVIKSTNLWVQFPNQEVGEFVLVCGSFDLFVLLADASIPPLQVPKDFSECDFDVSVFLISSF